MPLAPLVVLLVGIAVAFGIGLVGLDRLTRARDEHARARASLLSLTIAARLSRLPPSQRLGAVELAARRTGAGILVVTPDARVVHDVTLGAPDRAALVAMIMEETGAAVLRLGKARFAVRPIGGAEDAPRVIVFIAEPPVPQGTSGLVGALLALATILLGVALFVAHAVSRDVMRDVAFVTRRVAGMAHVRAEPTGELIPVRTMDEVGLLTTAFNKLVGRFVKAEKDYRRDLLRASSADCERAAFLAAVSHELRSPLNAILGFADILMEEVDGPLSTSAREEVEQIRGSGAHLLTLINDILEFSALESGQLRLARDRVDLTSLAQEVVREARVLVGDKPVTLRVEGEAVLVARVDGRRVRQILGNLVNNAVKFTQHGEVVVRVTREGLQAAIVVSDTGPGISAQERASIFDEYKQADSERARRLGTGLGLAIARRLVTLHKGAIGVESEVGCGSRFKVLLPLGDLAAAPSLRATHLGFGVSLGRRGPP